MQMSFVFPFIYINMHYYISVLALVDNLLKKIILIYFATELYYIICSKHYLLATAKAQTLCTI